MTMVVCPACGGGKVLLGKHRRDNKLCPGCLGEGEVSHTRVNAHGEKTKVRAQRSSIEIKLEKAREALQTIGWSTEEASILRARAQSAFGETA